MDKCPMCDGAGRMPATVNTTTGAMAGGDRCEHCNGNGLLPPSSRDNPRKKQSIQRPARSTGP